MPRHASARQVLVHQPQPSTTLPFSCLGMPLSVPSSLQVASGHKSLAETTRLLHTLRRAASAMQVEEQASSDPRQRIFVFRLPASPAHYLDAVTLELCVDTMRNQVQTATATYKDKKLHAQTDAQGVQQQAALNLDDLEWLRQQCKQQQLPADAVHQIVHRMTSPGQPATHDSTSMPYFRFSIGGWQGDRAVQTWTIQLDFRNDNGGLRFDKLGVCRSGQDTWQVTPRHPSQDLGTVSLGNSRRHSQCMSDTSYEMPQRSKPRIEEKDQESRMATPTNTLEVPKPLSELFGPTMQETKRQRDTLLQTFVPESENPLSTMYANVLVNALQRDDFAIIGPEDLPPAVRETLLMTSAAYVRIGSGDDALYDKLDAHQKSVAEQVKQLNTEMATHQASANLLAALAEQPLPTPRGIADGSQFFFSSIQRYRTAMTAQSQDTASENMQDAYYASNLLGEYISPQALLQQPSGPTGLRVQAVARRLGLQTSTKVFQDAAQLKAGLPQLGGNRLLVTYMLQQPSNKQTEMRLVLRADSTGQWWVVNNTPPAGWRKVEGNIEDALWANVLRNDAQRVSSVKVLSVQTELDEGQVVERMEQQYHATTSTAMSTPALQPDIESGFKPRLTQQNNVGALKRMESRTIAADVEPHYRDFKLEGAYQFLLALEQENADQDVTELYQDAAAFNDKLTQVGKGKATDFQNRLISAGKLLNPFEPLPGDRPFSGAYQGARRAFDRALLKEEWIPTTRKRINSLVKRFATDFSGNNPQVTSLKDHLQGQTDEQITALAEGFVKKPADATPNDLDVYNYHRRHLIKFLLSARDKSDVDAPPKPAAAALPAWRPTVVRTTVATAMAPAPLRTNDEVWKLFNTALKDVDSYSKETRDQIKKCFDQFCAAQTKPVEELHRSTDPKDDLASKISNFIFLKNNKVPMADSSQRSLRNYLAKLIDVLNKPLAQQS